MRPSSLLTRAATAALGVALAAGTAVAQPQGTLNIGGSLRIATGTFFLNILNGQVVESGSRSANRGDFALVGPPGVATGTAGTLLDLSPTPAQAPIAGWLTIGGYTFDLDAVEPGTNPQGNCSLAGQECTPTGTGINFENIGGNNSSLTFAVRGRVTGPVGTSAEGTSPFHGLISAQFTERYQAVVSGLPRNTTFSASLTANVVPEPSTYALMITGLGVLAGVAVRRRQRA